MALPPFEVKDHEDRTVPIPDTTVKIFRELLQAVDSECPFILLTPGRNRSVLARRQSFRRTGRSWESRCMMNYTLREFQRHAKRAGITQPRMNDLVKGCTQKFMLDALVNVAANDRWRAFYKVLQRDLRAQIFIDTEVCTTRDVS